MFYRMEVIPAGEVAGQDPFGGHGERLDFGDMPRAAAIDYLESRFGNVPWVAWDDHAWLDSRHFAPE
jgi:hypothetical protein